MISNSQESTVQKLRSELASIGEDANGYFEQVNSALEASSGFHSYSEVLTENHKGIAQQLRQRLASFGTDLLVAVKTSPVLEQTDETALRRVLRGMSAALSLKEWQYHEPYIIHDEDQFHGVMPASQDERDSDIHASAKRFFDGVANIEEKLDLVAPTAENMAGAIVASQVAGVRKYRPNTAFIIMQIDESNPELEDIKNTIKDVFKDFGITAIRSDEIEHSDVVTERILNEIATSEFLIADLTGERPSVYYELGYAHAVEKRPILYRKRGTRLHFDVAGFNCPEYKNVTELKEKLRTRLEEVTGRRPRS